MKKDKFAIKQIIMFEVIDNEAQIVMNRLENMEKAERYKKEC